MRSEMALRRPGSFSRRAAGVIAASALVLTLALGGCRAGGNQPTIRQGQSSTKGVSSNSSSGASTGGSNNSSLQQLETIDNQNQSDAQQLNSAQNDAGVNYSSQENQTQP